MWRSDPAKITLGVGLGDIDGDGKLDLVCGNASSANSVYLGSGDAFDSTSAWFPNPNFRTVSVALGDVDGDGKLDLVCGNTGEANAVYLNEGAMFALDPVLFSSDADFTGGVALGDINGDGDLDLVCGNFGQTNAVYLNEAGMFAAGSAWPSEPTHQTTGIALGDINGDGYLDLVCANTGQPNTVYLNDRGMFTLTPGWSSLGTARQTEGVALGDVDNDGDLDLVFANQLDSNTVYLGRKNPTYNGIPANATHQLANNGAFVSSVSVTEIGANVRRLRFSVVDVESDPVWILAEYQFEGDPRWYPARVGGQPGPSGLFASSPSGEADSLDWDITEVMFDPRNVILRFKVVEVPAQVSVIQHAPSYLKWVGPMVPRRSQVFTSTNLLDFASPLTFGDRDSLDLVVTNTGNVDLVVDSLVLPSPEMRVDVTGPIVIAPGSGVSIRVFVEPRQEIDISGAIELWSNDPLTPVDSIQVSTNIRALRVTSRLLASGPVIPLGEAATVIVEPLTDVHVEGGILFHRSAGTPDFSQVVLGPSGNDFIAVIPGAAVTETGLEYYVEVRNGGVFAADPPDAPADSLFFQAVEPPVSITSSPRPTSGDDFAEGQSIKIEVALPQGGSFVSGAVFYRQGGVQAYDTLALTLENGVPAALIPGSIVGSRGVEYWVELQTLTATVTDPSVSPANRPISIQVL
ncbi:MAG: VCBS repeat-containing protein, partial [Candidatus Krumholzibacteriota bacterium]|nr:VCBS repeat-containing protein [Candidatus Krumholzibacteriota bacterium]